VHAQGLRREAGEQGGRADRATPWGHAPGHQAREFPAAEQEENAPLKATDFGLSVFFKEGEVFRDIVGIAYYIVPEVLKRKYGPDADIWSAAGHHHGAQERNRRGADAMWKRTTSQILSQTASGTISSVHVQNSRK
jgi:hypothetical protein